MAILKVAVIAAIVFGAQSYSVAGMVGIVCDVNTKTVMRIIIPDDPATLSNGVHKVSPTEKMIIVTKDANLPGKDGIKDELEEAKTLCAN